MGKDMLGAVAISTEFVFEIDAVALEYYLELGGVINVIFLQSSRRKISVHSSLCKSGTIVQRRD